MLSSLLPWFGSLDLDSGHAPWHEGYTDLDDSSWTMSWAKFKSQREARGSELVDETDMMSVVRSIGGHYEMS